MRIVQLIDSLEAGGAERMAVNFANALVSRVEISALSTTRLEGALAKELSKDVSYLFLNRKKKIDIKALWRLRNFVAKHKIEWVHAHGTSFFMASLLKLVYPKIKIVWHDHNGNRVKMRGNNNVMLVVCSFLFYRVIVVNEELKQWTERFLQCKKIVYLPNFTVNNIQEQATTFLKGTSGKRIVCLANLRHPKNHITLLKAFHASHLAASGWSLHFIGKDSADDYSNILKDYIKNHNLLESVFVYGSCNDVFHILNQATIGVLASVYEGFPVTLLEYGLAGLPVISSNVGYCAEIICDAENGLLFEPLATEKLSEKLVVLAVNEKLRNNYGTALTATIKKRFSEHTVVGKYLDFIA